MLPEDEAGEDALLSRLRDGEHHEVELLDTLIEAVRAKRLRLAARLVGLLEDEHDAPEVARAKRAASLMLHRQQRPEDVSWSELDDALTELRERRMSRARTRMRQRASGKAPERIGRLDHRRRRR
jgi:hypothetical protein